MCESYSSQLFVCVLCVNKLYSKKGLPQLVDFGDSILCSKQQIKSFGLIKLKSLQITSFIQKRLFLKILDTCYEGMLNWP